METKRFKRLPYGISNFKRLRADNYIYVDKTRFIEYMEEENNPYQFFIRPRKFGKSLLFSMLSHYYDLNQAQDFATLFGDLYIGKNPTPHRNAYLMMLFDFSGLRTDSEENFTVDFNRSIEHTARAFFMQYANLLPGTQATARRIADRIIDACTGAMALRWACSEAEATGRRIYVVIDEYDHFANDLIAMGKYLGDDIYRRMIRANGLVRDFYETLKIGTKSAIDRIFITGISPVMMDDLTSGFNISDNLTTELKYNEMMGFTEADLVEIMSSAGINPAWISVDMKLYYDGYLFHPDGENRVYNPAMILYFFNQMSKYHRPPEYIIDDNLKTDYARLHRLVENEHNREKLMDIAKNNGIVSEIVRKFSIDNLHDDKYFVSLLFYMGLLTIDHYAQGGLHLKIPNYTVRTIYWEYIEQITQQWNSDVMVDSTTQKKAIWELAYRANPHPYIEYISGNIFSRLSNRDLERFDEKYIKIMLLNGLFQSRIYVPISEMEISTGYIDVFLQRSPLLPEIPWEWAWEIKYIKKNDVAQLPAKRKEAHRQLDRYRQSAPLDTRSDIRYLSLIFIGKDRYEISELPNNTTQQKNT